MKLFFSLFIGLLLLGGCAAKKEKVASGTGEPLLGLSLNYETGELTLQVVSTGCTVKEDFSLQVKNDELLVVRNKKDPCKAVPQATSFTYTMKEAGLNPDKLYAVKNGFIANPNLANIH